MIKKMQNKEDYIFNFYRYKKFKELYLVTLDDGSFRFFNESAFKQIKRRKIEDEKLLQDLKNFGLIIDQTNIIRILKKIKKRYLFLENGTSLHIIVPTMKCNLRCTYCFANADSIYTNEKNRNLEDMDEETAKKIVDFIFKTPSKALTIEFQGGECLLKFDIIKFIVKYANELNKKYFKDLRITIVSNLTLITDEMIEFFIDNNVSICTSLDGPKEVHDKNRIYLKDNKKIGSYDIVVKNIKRINKIYKKKGINGKVFSLPTITSFSLPYWKEILDEYVKLNIDMYDIRFLMNTGRAIDKNPLKEDFRKYLEFRNKSLKYISELRKKGIKISERMLNLYYKKIIENFPGYHADYESPCGAIIGQLLYFPNGEIYTCNEGLNGEEFCIGNVKIDSWKDIFKKKITASFILNSMIESNPMCDKCAYKPYCGTCQVENYYLFKKLDFYPTKTKRHFLTIDISEYFFNRIYNKLIKEVEKLDKKLEKNNK